MSKISEDLIQQIAEIRKDNRELWSQLGYKRLTGEDPVPDILRTVCEKIIGRAILARIARNDAKIAELTKDLAG
jgi:hypothetical protein